MMLERLVAMLNPYGRQAWLQPVLVSFGQTLIVLAVLFPDWISFWNGVKGLLIAGGVTLWMHVVRDQGKAEEKRLFREWGGMPSTAMLRHRDSRLDPVTKARYRRFLAAVVPELGTLTADVEEKERGRADEIYGSAGSWLRAQTRDRARFGLLLQENAIYGFRRNTMVLGRCAKWLDATVLTVCLVAGVLTLTGSRLEVIGLPSVSVWQVGGAALVSGLHLWLFCFRIRSAWVRAAADRYARELLMACDTLEREERLTASGGRK